MNTVERLARFALVTSDAAGLSRFYQHALGFRPIAAEPRPEPDLARSDGGAHSITLALGHEIVELLQFASPGRLYPTATSSSDLCFQHFAIVVADMALAYRQLRSVDGWTAISTDGPQLLPPSSGGVTAFKFRDPDGHPLELLAFPDGEWPAHWKARLEGDLFLGIDHSAISVSDSARSIAFYQALGLRVAARSLNSGREQERLDGISAPQVEVTALAPPQATPHLELLCYRSAMRDRKIALDNGDVAATRLVFAADRGLPENPARRQALIDPDGHHLVIVDPTLNQASLSAAAAAKADLPSISAKPE
jgi:catechol 2,3-dioxygenase-like lactoylglutathione lyase family enzyme